MTSIYDKAVGIISKPPESRRDFEVQPLLPWFQKRSQLFRTIKLDYLKDIARNCRFVQKAKDEIVIRQGDIGDCPVSQFCYDALSGIWQPGYDFYITLRGEVSIYNKDDAEKEEMATHASSLTSQTNDVMFFPDRSKLGNFVTNLGTGSNFGDIALVTGDCLRTATIIANETSDFIEVALDLYNRYVRDVLAKDFEQRTSFINTNPLFSGWAPKYRKQLAMALYKEEFPYDATLVKQGEPLANIYFIISGQVEVKLDTDMHEMQYPKLFQQTSTDKYKSTRKVERKSTNELPHVTASRRRDNHAKSVKICFLGMNGSVGDTEVLMDMETYLQTAVCVEKTEVLVLEMKHYDRLFVKRHPKTIEAMKSILEVRLNHRLAITHNKDMPLLRNIVLKLRETSYPVKEISKKGLTYADAEREYRNHRGPLIDLYGPGSVFHAIRIREKTRTKLKFHEQATDDQELSNGNNQEFSVYDDIPPMSQKSNVLPGDTPDLYVTSPVFDLETLSYGDIADYPMASEAFMLPDSGRQVMYTSAEDEVALTNLEERIRCWLTKSGPKSPTNVRSLRRLVVQKIDDFPKQGHKVIVRRRGRKTSPDMTSYNTCSVNQPREIASH